MLLASILPPLNAALNALSASLVVTGYSGSLETIRYMVAGGLGITILPCTAAGADRFSQRLLAIRRFAGDPPTRRVALAWRKSFPRPRAVDALRLGIQPTQQSCVRPIVTIREHRANG